MFSEQQYKKKLKRKNFTTKKKPKPTKKNPKTKPQHLYKIIQNKTNEQGK